MNVQATPRLRVRLWWDGYDPQILFESLNCFDDDPAKWEIRVKSAQDLFWRRPKRGTTVEEMAGDILEQDLSLLATELLRSRRRGRWEGRFELVFG